MRAVVLDERRLPVARDVPTPHPRAGELAVRVRAVGLCGSDVEKLGAAGVPGAVLGHEVSGVVEAGPLPVGTRVAVAHHVPCGACAACLGGHEPLCPQFTASGLRPGGFAEQLVASRLHVGATVLPLPDHVSDLAAVFVEPLACVLRATEQLPRGRGVVVGCGSIGLLFVRALAARGDTVCVLEPDARRLERAWPHATRPGAAGDELDWAVVTAVGGLDEGLAALRPGGTAVLFTAPSGAVPVMLAHVYRRELRLVGVRSTTPRHLRSALAALADGTIVADDLVTDVLPLERFVEGVDRYRRGDALKVVFAP